MKPLLQVKDLWLRYRDGGPAALRGVSMELRSGELVAVIGESGSGKSSLLTALAGLSQASRIEGSILFDGRELVGASFESWRRLRRGGVATLLQETSRALNPVFSVGRQLAEILWCSGLRGRDLRERRRQLLLEVGLGEELLHAYPHQLSGGMRQRVLLALALAQHPRLLLVDEPTTALDVLSERQIVELLRQRVEGGCALFWVGHDLELIAEHAQWVLVLYGGMIVESGPADLLFGCPRHPYTQRLLAAGPLDSGHYLAREEKGVAEGGCPFARECPLAETLCHNKLPVLEGAADGHQVRCWQAGVECCD